MPSTDRGPRVGSRTERVIAATRVVLGATSLFAIWLDPAEPARYVAATYSAHAVYVAYASVLAAIVWNLSRPGRLPLATHLADIVAFSFFQYLTLGPSSPFFIYFIFSLFCGALRWGWRGTLGTAVLVLAAFIGMGVSMSHTLGGTEFELNRFVIRAVYLCVLSGLLVYLGQHEIRLRREIERLAAWPAPPAVTADEVLRPVLAHAAATVNAGRALLAWDANDEPWVHLAEWSPAALTVSRHPPAEFEPFVADDLADGAFLAAGRVAATGEILVSREGRTTTWRGAPLHPGLLARLHGVGLASAAFHGERASGRVCFTDLADTSAELIPLTQVVAREIGASLDQLYATAQLRVVAAAEQRMRVARDLHDGVLQSLTGVRLKLQEIATAAGENPVSLRDRLLAIERAVAVEQRELRRFIDGLKPEAAPAPDGGTLAARLDAVRERLAAQWKVPIALRVLPRGVAMPAAIEEALPLMVHEAVVNALRHGQPTRVSVDVMADPAAIHLVVTDDGRGFPFKGRYDHDALVQHNAGPVSLRERAQSLGGGMTIESSAAGARVEIAVPLPAGVV